MSQAPWLLCSPLPTPCKLAPQNYKNPNSSVNQTIEGQMDSKEPTKELKRTLNYRKKVQDSTFTTEKNVLGGQTFQPVDSKKFVSLLHPKSSMTFNIDSKWKESNVQKPKSNSASGFDLLFCPQPGLTSHR